jgi:hypothetical protein
MADYLKVERFAARKVTACGYLNFSKAGPCDNGFEKNAILLSCRPF